MQKLVLSILMIFIMVTTAQAGNFYGGVTGGTTSITDTELEDNGTTPNDIELDLGFNVGAQLGYDFGPVRAGLEYTFRKNNGDQFEETTPAITIPFSDGSIDIHSYMAAGYLDWENKTKFTPYVGGGIGVAHVSFSNFEKFGTDLLVDDSDTVFAYKLEAGAAYEVVSNISVTAAYEYFATSDATFTDEDVPPADFDANLKSHNFKFGLRYAF